MTELPFDRRFVSDIGKSKEKTAVRDRLVDPELFAPHVHSALFHKRQFVVIVDPRFTLDIADHTLVSVHHPRQGLCGNFNVFHNEFLPFCIFAFAKKKRAFRRMPDQKNAKPRSGTDRAPADRRTP